MLEHTNRMFLPPSGWTDERIELLKALYADGLSASQIADELGGITRNSVIGKVHRLGLERNGRAPRKKDAGHIAREARARLRELRASQPEAVKHVSRKVKIRTPSNGGPVMVNIVVRDEPP